jgi:acylphosphatase
MTDAPKPATLRVHVSGIVQGVGYRQWLRTEAVRRGLAGWVRNRTDGSVEAVLHGDSAAVEAVAAACKKGPSMARVDKVQASPAEYDGTKEFRIELTV